MAQDIEDDGGPASAIRPPDDIVVPPKDIRRILEKSAGYIARRGDAFEERLSGELTKDPRLQFILPDNPYHPYYLWRKKEISEGRGFPDADGNVPTAVASKARKGPPEPEPFTFSARMPTISAVDLEVVKLTALFVAVKGNAWMTKFSQSYGQQNQFAFLRPQHSFHQFFQRIVDQYRELLLADGGELAARQERRMEELERNIADKYQLLDKAKARAAWVKHQEAEKVKEVEKTEAEKVAYAQIDWHKFTVVGTIEFTAADNEVDLPAPTSLVDVQSASLEQKSQFSVPIGRRLEEAFPTDDLFMQPPPPQPPQPSTSPLPPTPQSTQLPPPPQTYTPAQAASDPDATRIAERQQEAERAAAARAAASGTGPMRIRDNYVPRAQQRRQNVATSICPICGQAIPNDEYEKHVRIEQLDPRWREQTRIAQQRSATTNLSTADVANNLKRLASQRSDVFDPVTGRQIEDRDPKRQDTGHGPAPQQLPVPAPGIVGPGLQDPARSTDVQEQLRQLQSKYGAPPQG